MSDLTRYTGPVDPGPFSFRNPPGSTDTVETIRYCYEKLAIEELRELNRLMDKAGDGDGSNLSNVELREFERLTKKADAGVTSRTVTRRPTESGKEPQRVRFWIPDNGRDPDPAGGQTD